MTPVRVAGPSRLLAALVVTTLSASPSLAIVRHDAPGLTAAGKAILEPQRQILPAVDPQASKLWQADDPAWRAFTASAGGTWTARWDRRTDRLSFAMGSGVEWMPSSTRASDDASRAAGLQQMEALSRAFIASQPGLFRIPSGVELVRDTQRSGALDGGTVWYLQFQPRVGGVAVEGATVFFRISHGRLTQFGETGISDDLAQAPRQPLIHANAAVAAHRLEVSMLFGEEAASKAREVGERELALVGWAADARAYAGAPGEGLEHRLAWRTAMRVPGQLETWVALHDAVSGERLALEDGNRYACAAPAAPQGRVVGGVYLGPIEEVPETRRPMPYAAVDNGGAVGSDYNGVFPVTPGQPATSTLSGTTFDMNCEGCSSPVQASATQFGDVDLGVGGSNQTGNGLSTRAERNCYYHLNIVRQLAATYLSDAEVNRLFSRTTPATVNIGQNCNAFWDGNGVNFFRGGSGCNNTGEIADVMQHEWGHGLDQFTGGGANGARGEGVGDTVAFMTTHDSRLGPYFLVGNPAGIRDADENVTGLYTLGNVGSCGGEVHCAGQVFAEAWWHLARNLRAKYGEAGGWDLAAKLFFRSMPLSDDHDPSAARNTYDAVIMIDDDNGNLADGTPDAAEINEAFAHHDMAGRPQVADSAECVPPAAPPLTLTSARDTSTGLWQVGVAWTPVPGASTYLVFRNDASGRGAQELIGTVFPPSTQLVDGDVGDGVRYTYRVEVLNGTGCVSVGDNVQSVDVAADISLSLSGFQIDDSGPGANFDRVVEPGESLAISADFRNTGSLDATAVRATLSTATTGVTVTGSVANLGAIASGGTASTAPPHFTFTVGSSVACGSVITFDLSLEAAEGCSVRTFSVPVGRPGPFVAAVSDDLESATGWRVNPGGTDAATTGIWVREAPLQTGAPGAGQPGEDHTAAPGTLCWVTGNSPSNLGNVGDDDVDRGCTTLQSPTWNLGGAPGFQLSYWRYFQITTALDDTFLVEISNDGGANWQTLETVTGPIQPFQQVSFDLDFMFGRPADRVALRFTACDTGGGSVIEALVDDVLIGRSTTVCEAPQPRPRLTYVGAAVGDSPAFGGMGNGNASIDPGENDRIAVALQNGGNAGATAVAGTIALLSAPPGTIVTDPSAAWPDLAVGATARTGGALPQHFEIMVPASAPCGGQVVLALDVTYSGPSGSYTLSQDITLDVGTDVVTNMFFDDFEGGDNGFTHGANCPDPGCDDWMHDAPTTASPFDTGAAHSGTKVWANDVGGDRNGQPYDGNYRANVANWLQSPPIDCTGRTGVKLSFWRWLSVEEGQFDHARVVVNGTTVWENQQAGNTQDTAWTYQELDISALADNNPSVSVRFELESDGGLQLGGWTVDDLRVFTRVRTCYPVNCTGAVTPGPVGPWLRATGSKGEDHAEFSWLGATLGAQEHYDLYRGTSPASLVTLVTPSGFVGTRFDDLTASGPLYFYRVVNESCSGALGPRDP